MLGDPEMDVCTRNENFELNNFEEVSAFSKPGRAQMTYLRRSLHN
jgi:hypothetical protein